jgi:hypothetical protein
MTARKTPPGMDQPDSYDYEGLKRIAYRLRAENRTTETLIALSRQNDPFYIDPDGARQTAAEWFAKLWKNFKIGDGVHLRRLHYLFISQPRPLPTPYENSNNCWQYLLSASKDARYLDLVPIEAFVDRRNPDAIPNAKVTGEPNVEVDDGDDLESLPDEMPDPPQALLNVPEPAQRYQIELWCEKTTMDDILQPLAERYGITYVPGAGQTSLTLCYHCSERAKADGRPVRILYVSDFDHQGQSMPVAMARKVEFELRNGGFDDLDVQVRAVALTEDQIKRYDLPRFLGTGATELDALEAKNPGELAKILEKEIARYYDATLAQRTNAKAKPVKVTLNKFNREIRDRFADQIEKLEEEYSNVVAAHQAFVEHAETVWHAISERLDAEMPDTSGVKWPKPKAGDEDSDPLFDSTRDYVDQIDCYKAFQGKRTERKPGTGSVSAARAAKYRHRR